VVQDKATTGGATPLAWVASLVALLSITFGTIYQKRFGSGIDWYNRQRESLEAY
jgi:hypothetical protein